MEKDDQLRLYKRNDGGGVRKRREGRERYEYREKRKKTEWIMIEGNERIVPSLTRVDLPEKKRTC